MQNLHKEVVAFVIKMLKINTKMHDMVCNKQRIFFKNAWHPKNQILLWFKYKQPAAEQIYQTERDIF